MVSIRKGTFYVTGGDLWIFDIQLVFLVLNP